MLHELWNANDGDLFHPTDTSRKQPIERETMLGAPQEKRARLGPTPEKLKRPPAAVGDKVAANENKANAF
jgi:hypothetical protein